MTLEAILFYLFALVTIGAGSAVVFSRNIVRSAFSLLFAFFGVAGIYVFLLADFIAVTQLLIYVGGILVLILFGVMLTNRQVNVDIKTNPFQWFPATVIAGMVGGLLLAVLVRTEWGGRPAEAPLQTAPEIGTLLLSQYLLPFEIASVLLLVALVGSVMIARRDRNRPS